MLFYLLLNTSCRGFDHAIVIVHTHSDNDTGDLWFCSNDAESGGPAATPIGSVCVFFLHSQISNGHLVLWQHCRGGLGSIYRRDEVFSIFPARMWGCC